MLLLRRVTLQLGGSSIVGGLGQSGCKNSSCGSPASQDNTELPLDCPILMLDYPWIWSNVFHGRSWITRNILQENFSLRPTWRWLPWCLFPPGPSLSRQNLSRVCCRSKNPVGPIWGGRSRRPRLPGTVAVRSVPLSERTIPHGSRSTPPDTSPTPPRH